MLPGLEPQHTRQSFCSGTRLYLENVVESPDDFVKAENGLWLLPPSVAERDRLAGVDKLELVAAAQYKAGMESFAEVTAEAADILDNSDVTDDGCIVDGLTPDRTMSSSELVLYLAGAEWGSPALDEVDDLPHLQTCETDGCYNTRHFDLDFAKLQVPTRITELNPHWYEVGEDGEVYTIWGDHLANIEESMALYIKLQKSNFPYVPFDKSPLTPSGVAQVRLHPLTGCWESWTYNIKPDGSRGGRFEGYGNLYFRYRPETVDRQTGEITREKRRGHWLAHRLMWTVMGQELDSSKVLNHLCNYKRCCNPLHLEQITEDENKIHGRNARGYIRELERANPSVRDDYLDAATIAGLYKQARRMYQAAAA